MRYISSCIVLAMVLFCGCMGSSGPLLTKQGVKSDYTVMSSPVGLNIDVAIDYDADGDEIEKIKKGIQRFSMLLWNNTYGNMYVNTAHLTDKKQNGYVNLRKMAQRQGGHARFGGVFTVNTALLNIGRNMNRPEVGLRVFAAGLLHEFNHSMFHLPDEYPYAKKDKDIVPKKNCVMDPRSRTTVLCEDCQGRLLKRFKNWKFPQAKQREKWTSSNKVPDVKFVVTNN